MPYTSSVESLRGYLGTLAPSIAAGWNVDHRPDGGHHAIHEYGRLTALGVWIDLSFLASRFTGGGTQTWTLTSGDQSALRYTLIGKTMTLAWDLRTTSVGGAAATTLKIALPTLLMPSGVTIRYRATALANGTHWYSDNGTVGIGRCQVTARGTTVDLYLMGLGNWAGAANTTATAGTFPFEVETY